MRGLTHVVLIAALLGAAPARAAASARTSYSSALARERVLRSAAARGRTLAATDFRSVVSAYRAVVRRYPTSGYSDNALWQAAGLATDAYSRFRDDRDRVTASRLLSALVTSYPFSSLVPRARAELARVDRAAPAPGDLTSAIPSATGTGGRREPPQSGAFPNRPATATAAIAPAAAPVSVRPQELTTIRSIHRTILSNLVRITLEFDSEALYHEERLPNPSRMFLDFRSTRTDAPLTDAVLSYEADAVKQIKLGRHPNNTTRVVVDLEGVARYSVFTLYNPFRVVIDCERQQDLARAEAGVPATPLLPSAPIGPTGFTLPATDAGFRSNLNQMSPLRSAADTGTIVVTVADAPGPVLTPVPEVLVESVALPPPVPVAPLGPPPANRPAVPAAPSTNLQGGFSLARQLGLGISRIVIDAGHGGHDPGAQAGKLSEADLVLDIALRLEKGLLKQPGVEVILTRRSNVFIPLEERTALANREAADLFLSIHANASRNERAHGVETYHLNFASNPDAEAVAARENSASGGTMNSLPDIVKAIALNNKLDESRDFATLVQRSMVSRLRVQNKQVRDLGVKQAPFVVLIGAGMPSVLAEISFVTNRQEAQFLKNGGYRQRIADALLLGITNYQQSLKKAPTVADGNTLARPN